MSSLCEAIFFTLLSVFILLWAAFLGSWFPRLRCNADQSFLGNTLQRRFAQYITDTVAKSTLAHRTRCLLGFSQRGCEDILSKIVAAWST